MATIDDVAKRVGVSRMTVSRVINKNGYVKEETSKQVLQAIKELNYRPNIIAKTLVTHKSRTLAYVMVNISDPFHNLVSQGMESVAFHSQYTTMMCDTHSVSRLQDYIEMFCDHFLGGAVFHHLAITREEVDAMEANGIRCVLMDNEKDIEGVCTVNTDSYSGGRMAVDYLLSKGHRRIGCVHGVMERPQGENIPYEDTFQFNIWKQRTAGYTDAMKDAGIAETFYFQSNGRSEVAAPLTKGIVREILTMNNPPTALYCENDVMAIAVLNELQEHNVKVPGEMAIIGHDGLDICKILHPYITTVAQPRYQMGREAAVMLIDQIENNSPAKTICLSPKIDVGETA